MQDDRLPFRVSAGAEAYDSISRLPVAVLLDNLRSAFNVGSFFRTADAGGIDRLLLCGFTSAPPHKSVLKTALGAEKNVPWSAFEDPALAARTVQRSGYQLAAIETTVGSVDLFDWVPEFPVCLMFGNEIEGLRPELAALSDVNVRIPMLGVKYSLNVGTAGGIVIFELLRKYRELVRSGGRC
jgi:23S rRNA (guanosine2251-2'-O)-methyltransferase